VQHATGAGGGRDQVGLPGWAAGGRGGHRVGATGPARVMATAAAGAQKIKLGQKTFGPTRPCPYC
jgi:hypothetical protein